MNRGTDEHKLLRMFDGRLSPPMVSFKKHSPVNEQKQEVIRQNSQNAQEVAPETRDKVCFVHGLDS
jgi:hypothetical protein